MAEAATRQRFLIISNGHGEDAIAAQFVRLLPDSVSAEAYPMIGNGNAYQCVCPIVGPRATLASEGWRNVKGSVRRDIVNGGLMTVPPALKFLRAAKSQYDRVIVIGDVTGVLACLLTGHRNIIYLDVYKTGAARLYSRMERFVIKKACKLVFCRAKNLAELLNASGVDARFAGNVMMDTVPYGDYNAELRRSRPFAITLLPGSRALTAESFALQVAALRLLPNELKADIFLAVAGSVNVDELARAAGLSRVAELSTEPDDLGALADGTLKINLARGRAMGNLLRVSDLVLSQAGTATVQSLGMGRPVITFRNARDRRSRFEDEQNLFGEARVVVDANAESIAQALLALMSSAEERARLGDIGRQRIGGPGALDTVLAELTA